VQDAFLGMLEAHPAMYARTFASNWAPTADGATLERLARAVRDQDQHQSALRLKQTWATDLRAVLPRVPMPTLAFQRRDRVIPQSEPAEVAAAVQQGQMRILNGNDHWQWLGDWAEVVAALETFVDGLSQGPSASAAEGAIQTILFTDLESSTALTQTVGDDAAQEIVRGHNVTVRKALEAHGGREVKHTGDGIMAAFPSAVRAVEAALQVQRDLAGGEVRVRMGLNAGEPIAEDGDYFGTAVQLAARICDRAEPRQVLVSRVVADLRAGKRLQFRHHSDATLKGFAEPVALYEVG
jgi:class 3 adenylate cyclase